MAVAQLAGADDLSENAPSMVWGCRAARSLASDMSTKAIAIQGE